MDEQLKERIEQATEAPKPKELSPMEEREMQDGMALFEMTATAGWQVLKNWLEGMAYHSWVDPRTIDKAGGPSKEEWEWRELNAFHASNVAKELVESIEQVISRSQYLQKLKVGEIKGAQKMRV